MERKNTFYFRKNTAKAVLAFFLTCCIFSIFILFIQEVLKTQIGNSLSLVIYSACYCGNVYTYTNIHTKKIQRNSFSSRMKFSLSLVAILFIPQIIASIFNNTKELHIIFLWHSMAVFVSSVLIVAFIPKFLMLVYHKKVLPSPARIQVHNKSKNIFIFSAIISLFLLIYCVASSKNSLQVFSCIPSFPLFIREFSMLCCCNACCNTILSRYKKL